MGKLIAVKRGKVKAASAKFEKLLAKDKEGKREIRERKAKVRAIKTQRDREHRATLPKRNRK